MALLIQYRYWILFPIACFEGPIVGFTAGILVAAGVFNPFIAFAILLLGDVMPDITYYLIGRFGDNRGFLEKIQEKFKIPPAQLEKVRHLWFTRTTRTMFITKFAYGLSTPLLISAGLVKLPFRRFIMNTTPLSVLQYSVLMTLGYFLGSSYAFIESGIVRFQLLILAIAIFAGVFYFFGKRIRKMFWSS